MENTKNRYDGVKILVCCHKSDMAVSEPPYLPIHVGKAVSGLDLGIPGDDTGDNISRKNRSWCELTGIYWAWKNLRDTEIVGLCHYRRYFDFHGKIRMSPYKAFPSSEIGKADFSIPEKVLDKVRKGHIVAAKERVYPNSIFCDYAINHNSDDFRTLEQVIRETCDGKIREAFFESTYRSNGLSHFNMFIMRREDFDEYCSWLFPVLEEVERRVNISNYSDYQKRIFGFMAERLFNAFLYTKKGRVMKFPVLWFNDEQARKPAKTFRHALLRVIYRLCFFPIRLLTRRPY